MKVIAQSQPPAKFSYIHLAYISAQLNNRISKGELLPVQAILGVAVATAIACGAIGAKLADLTNNWSADYLKPTFEAALEKGKLTEAERTWTKQRLARMAEQMGSDTGAAAKH